MSCRRVVNGFGKKMKFPVHPYKIHGDWLDHFFSQSFCIISRIVTKVTHGHAACVVCGMLIVRSVPWHTHRPYARLEPKVFIMILHLIRETRVFSA